MASNYAKFASSDSSREPSAEPRENTATSLKFLPPQTRVDGGPRRLRLYTGLRIILLLQIGMAVSIFFFGSSCVVYSRAIVGDPRSCLFASGIWVGLFNMVLCVLGFFGLRTPHGQKGLLIPYMVVEIFSCLANGLLLLFSVAWISINHPNWHYFGDKPALVAVVFNSFLLIFAFTFIILNIVSSAFLCLNLCEKKSDVVVVYYPQQTTVSNGTVSEESLVMHQPFGSTNGP